MAAVQQRVDIFVSGNEEIAPIVAEKEAFPRARRDLDNFNTLQKL